MTSPKADPGPKCVHFKRSNGACLGEVKKHAGAHFCPIHHPAADRIAEFVTAFHQKIENSDFNFAWARVPMVLLTDEQEWTGDADFSHAVFTGDVAFRNVFAGNAKFFNARFQGYFGASTVFRGAVDFTVCEFAGTANFVDSKFEGPVNFLGAKIVGPAMFDRVTFASSASFAATFGDSVSFTGTEEQNAFALDQRVSFDAVRFDKPDLVMFYDSILRPVWFIGGSASKVTFRNITWDYTCGNEIRTATDIYGSLGYTLMAEAYRELAINSEDEHRYREASDFRYASMEAQRFAKKNGHAFWTLHWWYWVASGYGERIGRATLALVALWLLFGLIYTQVGFARTDVQPTIATQQVASVPEDTVGRPLRLSKALMYSLGTLSLQKPDPKPVTDAATFFVIVESVFGPLQAALLILAVRRKFMR